jgi:hypothetical protein
VPPDWRSWFVNNCNFAHLGVRLDKLILDLIGLLVTGLVLTAGNFFSIAGLAVTSCDHVFLFLAILKVVPHRES